LWEIEFQLNINFNTFANYNNLEYFELIWHYERLVEFRKKENEQAKTADGRMSLSNLSSDIFQKMNGQKE